MKNKPFFAFIGDLTVDKYIRQNEIRLGGGALNTAIWAKRFGAKGSVVTAVGSDVAGRKQVELLNKLGIDALHVRKLRGKTSSIEIFVDETGERRYGAWDPGTLSIYHLRPIDVAFLRKQDSVCITIYPQYIHILDELARAFRTSGKKPLTVVNYGDLREFSFDMTVVEEYYSLWDIAVFGLDKDTDEQYINRLREFAREQDKLIVITLGKYGSIAYYGSQQYAQIANDVPVVDTTGAGDSFLAAFLVTFLNTHKIQESLAAGTTQASEGIQRLGAY